MVPPLPARPRALVFDLDGTLTDPKPGITGSVQYALAKLGRPVPTQDELEWVIGPPLKSAFARMLGPGGDVDEGVRLYRERYSVTGLFENEVIQGIPELLDNLLNDNRILYVATSKPRVFAQRILDHFELSRRFVAIHGSELDGTQGGQEGPAPLRGRHRGAGPGFRCHDRDREHDVHGARSVGMGTIGVRWGYGSDAELTAAGVAALVDRPAEIGVLAGMAEAAIT